LRHGGSALVLIGCEDAASVPLDVNVLLDGFNRSEKGSVVRRGGAEKSLDDKPRSRETMGHERSPVSGRRPGRCPSHGSRTDADRAFTAGVPTAIPVPIVCPR